MRKKALVPGFVGVGHIYKTKFVRNIFNNFISLWGAFFWHTLYLHLDTSTDMFFKQKLYGISHHNRILSSPSGILKITFGYMTSLYVWYH